MQKRATQLDKTLRAFGAYLDLLDTVDWLEHWMRPPLESFDLTIRGFRLLVLLYRHGPLPMTRAAKELRCRRPNVNALLRRLERLGWLRRELVRLPAANVRPSRIEKARRHLPRRGLRIITIRLTPKGRDFLAYVFPRHAKVVKALMRAIPGRDQHALARICRKLRAGNVMKFMSEITHPDAWEQDDEEVHEEEPEEEPGEEPEQEEVEEEELEDFEPQDAREPTANASEQQPKTAALAAHLAPSAPNAPTAIENQPKMVPAPQPLAKLLAPRPGDSTPAPPQPPNAAAAAALIPAPTSPRTVEPAPPKPSRVSTPAAPSHPAVSDQSDQALLQRRIYEKATEAKGPNQAVWEAANPQGGKSKPKPQKFARLRHPRPRR